MKYLIFESPTGPYIPIVFSGQIDHSVMKRMVQGIYPGYEFISAGKVNLGLNKDAQVKFFPIPGSTTLKIQCSEEQQKTDVKIFESWQRIEG